MDPLREQKKQRQARSDIIGGFMFAIHEREVGVLVWLKNKANVWEDYTSAYNSRFPRKKRAGSVNPDP